MIGVGNKIGPYVVIGNDAQHPNSNNKGKIINKVFDKTRFLKID